MKIRYRKGGKKGMEKEEIKNEAVVKPKVEPIMIGDIFIWPNVNSRGKYYTFSKKNTRAASGYDSLFVTEVEYKLLRGEA